MRSATAWKKGEGGRTESASSRSWRVSRCPEQWQARIIIFVLYCPAVKARANMGGRRPQTLCLTVFYTVLPSVLTSENVFFFIFSTGHEIHPPRPPLFAENTLRVVEESTLLIRYRRASPVRSRAFSEHPVRAYSFTRPPNYRSDTRDRCRNVLLVRIPVILNLMIRWSRRKYRARGKQVRSIFFQTSHTVIQENVARYERNSVTEVSMRDN